MCEPRQKNSIFFFSLRCVRPPKSAAASIACDIIGRLTLHHVGWLFLFLAVLHFIGQGVVMIRLANSLLADLPYVTPDDPLISLPLLVDIQPSRGSVATDKLFAGQANRSWGRWRVLQMHTNVGDIVFRVVPRNCPKAGYPIHSLHAPESTGAGCSLCESWVWVSIGENNVKAAAGSVATAKMNRESNQIRGFKVLCNHRERTRG